MEDFTDEEKAALKRVAKYEDTIVRNARYRSALTIIGERWKGIIISLAAVLAAVDYFWGKFIIQASSILR